MCRKQVWGKESVCVCQSARVERKEKKKISYEKKRKKFRMKRKEKKKSCEKNEKELKSM